MAEMEVVGIKLYIAVSTSCPVFVRVNSQSISAAIADKVVY